MQTMQRQQIEALYMEMFEKMTVYAKVVLENEALAEEAVQETFRIACQKPEQLCRSNNPQGWLVNALKNTIRNIQKNREAAKRLVEKYLMTQLKAFSLADDRLDLHVLYEDLANTEEFKLLMEMAVEGKSHLEMANSRGISVSACKKRVQRAKETLREKMDE